MPAGELLDASSSGNVKGWSGGEHFKTFSVDTFYARWSGGAWGTDPGMSTGYRGIGHGVPRYRAQGTGIPGQRYGVTPGYCVSEFSRYLSTMMTLIPVLP
ncbi:hypothetical protein LWI28_001851 [Acer negundo]|uniref:Uncharacterized protein n=1 Tax=Acer negundo TaxID=4023 RepID=A0AAD5IBN6_ACENE|nr:hypothetical protein LWI28_001851 [Acer negundo]